VHVNPAINETSKNSGEKAVRRYLLGVPLLIRGGDIAHQLAATARSQEPTFSSSAVVVYASDSSEFARILSQSSASPLAQSSVIEPNGLGATGLKC